MANEILKRDSNNIPVGGSVTNDANLDIVMDRVDPTTKGKLVQVVGTGSQTFTSTTALAESLVTSGATRMFGAYGFIDATAASDVYYIQFFDSDSEPADATSVSASMPTPVIVNHATGTDTPWEINLSQNPPSLTNDLAVVVSTTHFTKTEAGDVASITAITD